MNSEYIESLRNNFCYLCTFSVCPLSCQRICLMRAELKQHQVSFMIHNFSASIIVDSDKKFKRIQPGDSLKKWDESPGGKLYEKLTQDVLNEIQGRNKNQ